MADKSLNLRFDGKRGDVDKFFCIAKYDESSGWSRFGDINPLLDEFLHEWNEDHHWIYPDSDGDEVPVTAEESPPRAETSVDQRIKDSALLILKLCRALSKSDDGHPLVERANDFLQRNSLANISVRADGLIQEYWFVCYSQVPIDDPDRLITANVLLDLHPLVWVGGYAVNDDPKISLRVPIIHWAMQINKVMYDLYRDYIG